VNFIGGGAALPALPARAERRLFLPALLDVAQNIAFRNAAVDAGPFPFKC
jgi:hypothetical protein